MGESLVQGEALPRPVAGGAEAAHLPADIAAGFFLPLPNLLQKGAASELMSLFPLRLQTAFHQHLGGDAGVVGAGLPERALPLHPCPADEDVHQGVLKGMTHMQGAGNIGRRQHDAVGGAIAAWAEHLLLLPELITGTFDVGRRKRAVEGIAHGTSSGVCGWMDVFAQGRGEGFIQPFMQNTLQNFGQYAVNFLRHRLA